ncbi:hypothetical protein T484DRAFT_1783461 [Baffinella frigidus]|nr:hypothetical protein T484DRAFT_1783461 [Cryptophyta sp. CCMP2293]
MRNPLLERSIYRQGADGSGRLRGADGSGRLRIPHESSLVTPQRSALRRPLPASSRENARD